MNKKRNIIKFKVSGVVIIFNPSFLNIFKLLWSNIFYKSKDFSKKNITRSYLDLLKPRRLTKIN